MKGNIEFKYAFAVGDLVAWSSQGAGLRVTKRGRVVEVVPPMGKPKTMPKKRYRAERDHDSYVVEVSTPLKRGGVKSTRHWPRRAHLTPDTKAGPAGARKGAAEPAPPSSSESGASYIERNHLPTPAR